MQYRGKNEIAFLVFAEVESRVSLHANRVKIFSLDLRRTSRRKLEGFHLRRIWSLVNQYPVLVMEGK